MTGAWIQQGQLHVKDSEVDFALIGDGGGY